MASFEYKFTINPTYIYASLHGCADKQDILATYRELASLARQYELSRLLVDTRKLELNYDGFNVVEVLNQLTSILSQCKLARLAKVQDYKNSLIQVFSDQNKMQLKNFEDEQSALKWLLD